MSVFNLKVNMLRNLLCLTGFLLSAEALRVDAHPGCGPAVVDRPFDQFHYLENNCHGCFSVEEVVGGRDTGCVSKTQIPCSGCTVDGDEHIISCHWLAFLGAFGHLQLIQNSVLSTISVGVKVTSEYLAQIGVYPKMIYVWNQLDFGH